MLWSHNIICWLILTVDKLPNRHQPLHIHRMRIFGIGFPYGNTGSNVSAANVQSIFKVFLTRHCIPYFDYIFRNQNSDHNRTPKPNF